MQYKVNLSTNQEFKILIELDQKLIVLYTVIMKYRIFFICSKY